jgi:hypothetical protein
MRVSSLTLFANVPIAATVLLLGSVLLVVVPTDAITVGDNLPQCKLGQGYSCALLQNGAKVLKGATKCSIQGKSGQCCDQQGVKLSPALQRCASDIEIKHRGLNLTTLPVCQQAGYSCVELKPADPEISGAVKCNSHGKLYVCCTSTGVFVSKQDKKCISSDDLLHKNDVTKLPICKTGQGYSCGLVTDGDPKMIGASKCNDGGKLAICCNKKDTFLNKKYHRCLTSSELANGGVNVERLTACRVGQGYSCSTIDPESPKFNGATKCNFQGKLGHCCDQRELVLSTKARKCVTLKEANGGVDVSLLPPCQPSEGMACGLVNAADPDVQGATKCNYQGRLGACCNTPNASMDIKSRKCVAAAADDDNNTSTQNLQTCDFSAGRSCSQVKDGDPQIDGATKCTYANTTSVCCNQTGVFVSKKHRRCVTMDELRDTTTSEQQHDITKMPACKTDTGLSCAVWPQHAPVVDGATVCNLNGQPGMCCNQAGFFLSNKRGRCVTQAEMSLTGTASMLSNNVSPKSIQKQARLKQRARKTNTKE